MAQNIQSELQERDYIAINESKNIFIEAGAGAGKSTSLVGRIYYTLGESVEALNIQKAILSKQKSKQDVINELSDFTNCLDKEKIFRTKLISEIDDIIAGNIENIMPNDIYAITFTNKATEELRAKIVEKLVDKTDCTDREIARKEQILQNIDKIHISTIHKFCEDILKENAVHAGLSPNLVPVIGDEESDIKNKVIRDYFRRFNRWTDFTYFEPTGLTRQKIKEGILSVFKSLLSTADHVALNQIYRCNPIKGNPIKQRDEAIKELLDGLDSFHDQYQKPGNVLYDVKKPVGGSGYEYRQPQADRDIAIENLKKVTAKTWFDAMNDKAPVISRPAKTIINDVKTYFTPLLEKVTNAQSEINICIVQKYIVYAFELYQEYLNNRQNDVEKLTSNDLVYRTYQLLAEDKKKNQGKQTGVLYKTRKKVKRLFIDEYQDTDSLQYEIASLIAEGRSDCLYIVGDPKQSIYRFRGAEPDVFFNTKQVFENDKSNHSVYNLNINFRSNSKIIEWVNDRYSKIGLIDPSVKYVYTPMFYAPKNEINPSDYLDTKNLIGFYRFAGTEKEDIKDLILYLKQNHLVRKDGIYRNIKFKDIMVLMEDHKKMPSFVETFTKSNIPAKVFGESRFYNTLAVRCFISLFEAILVDDDSSIALVESVYYNLCPGLYTNKSHSESQKISKGLLNGLRKETINMSAFGKAVYLVEHMSLLMKEKHAYQDFEINFASSKLYQMIETVFSQGYYNSNQLIAEFRAFVDNSVERESLIQSDIDAVQIINLHKAKGLEAPIVIWVSVKAKKTANDNKIGDAYKNGTLYPSTLLNEAKYHSAYQTDIQKIADEEDYEMARKEYVAVTRAGEAFIFADKGQKIPMFHDDRRDYRLNDSDVREIMLPHPEVEESGAEQAEGEETAEEATEEVVESIKNEELEENATEDTPLYDGEKEQKLLPGSSSINSESPSSKENSSSPLRDKLRKEAGDNIAESNRPKSNNVGTILHRALQLLIRDKLSPLESVEIAMNENANLVRAYEMEKKFYLTCVKAYEKWFNENFKKDVYELFTEFGFSYYEDTANVISNGSIDLLMKQGDDFIVIDYKSDEAEYIKDDAVFEETLKEKYKPQLESYEKVVKDLFTVKSIKKLIIYFRRYDDIKETIDVCCYEIK